MLVLTRRKDEAIIIDGRIRVTILGIKGNRVRLGITAPAEVPIQREEVHQRIVTEEADAKEPQTA